MQYVGRRSSYRILTSAAVYTQTFGDDSVDPPLPHAMPALPDAYMQEYEIFIIGSFERGAFGVYGGAS